MSNAVPGKTSVDMVIGGGVSTLRSPFNRHASRQVPEVTDTLEGTVEAASTRALPLGSTAILTVPKEITRLCFAENAQNIVAQLPGIRNIFQCGKKKKKHQHIITKDLTLRVYNNKATSSVRSTCGRR